MADERGADEQPVNRLVSPILDNVLDFLSVLARSTNSTVQSSEVQSTSEQGFQDLKWYEKRKNNPRTQLLIFKTFKKRQISGRKIPVLQPCK